MRVIAPAEAASELNWLGTDEFGRDMLSRIIFGARASLGIGAAVVVISMTVGTVARTPRRIFPAGWTAPVMRVVDAMMSLPDILLAIVLVAVLGASHGNVMLALSIVYTPRVVRVVRASTLVVRELPFVEAARALGVSTRRILTVHILLNIASPVLVQATFIFAYAVLAEAGLSFLGVGVPPEMPTWGTMIASGQQYRGPGLLGRAVSRARHRAGRAVAADRGRWLPRHARPQAAEGDVIMTELRSALGSTNLEVSFRTEAGVVKAVRGVTLARRRGRDRRRWSANPAPASRSPASRSWACCRVRPAAFRGGQILFRRRAGESVDLARLPVTRHAAAARRRDRDDLPGADDEPQPGADDRRADRGVAAACISGSAMRVR